VLFVFIFKGLVERDLHDTIRRVGKKKEKTDSRQNKEFESQGCMAAVAA
jgi:hypothetical protein